MKIVLLYNHNELDRNVLEPVSYDKFEEKWREQGGGNSGNKLFISAVEQYICQQGVEYGYLDNRLPEQINEEYDLGILPLANILNANKGVMQQLEQYTNLIEKLSIPVFVIGIGLQTKSYDDIHELSKIIKRPVQRFLKAIYNKGGELALRGYATKELLDKIDKNTAVVTGCPSMYQKGRTLKINKTKVSQQDFKPVINGNLSYLQSIGFIENFGKYSESIYLDQDEFAEMLYYKNLFNEKIKFKDIFKMIQEKTLVGIELFCHDRVKLIYDIPVWMEFLKQYDFSCGSRIHGNIIALLSGIPANVIVRDARTREIAEFYHIPTASEKDICKEIDIYDLYLKADYKKFNDSFAAKYDQFQEFLKKNNIVENIEDRSFFESKRNAEVWIMPEESKNIIKVKQDYEKKKVFYAFVDIACKIRGKMI